MTPLSFLNGDAFTLYIHNIAQARCLELTESKFRDTEEILQGSSEDDIVEAPIMTTYDTMYASTGGGLLCGSQPTNPNLSALHPQPVHIFRLWQTFLDNVNPLIKIFHAPTVQQQILENSGNLENVSKEMEALMFGIYSFAVTSLDDANCQTMIGEEKASLLGKYQFELNRLCSTQIFLDLRI